MEIWNNWSESYSLIYFYIVLNKNIKIYWSEQSFTGLEPEDQCSSWGLFIWSPNGNNHAFYHIVDLKFLLHIKNIHRLFSSFIGDKLNRFYHKKNILYLLLCTNTQVVKHDLLGTDHLTWRGGGGYGFLFYSKNFFRTTQELEYLFFLSCKAQIFFPEFNIRLYDNNSESDYYFFPPPKSEYFFQQHWESEYFFRIKP